MNDTYLEPRYCKGCDMDYDAHEESHVGHEPEGWAHPNTMIGRK